jgi:hypothetical protein
MNNAVEPPSSSRRWREDIVGEPLHEDLRTAQHGVAPEAARNNLKLDAPSRQRQIADPTMVPTMHAPRSGTAGRTYPKIFRRADRDCRRRGIMDRRHHNEAAGHQ